jgi:hypothetical protein
MGFDQPEIMRNRYWLDQSQTQLFWDLTDTRSLFPEAALWEYPGDYPNTGNDEHAAITKALSELSPDQQQFGAALGESKQVVDMFLSTAQTLASAILSVKRGNFKLAAKHLGLTRDDLVSGTSPANAWLQLQYGWKPLVSDLHGLQQQVHKKFLKGTEIEAQGFNSSTVVKKFQRGGLDITATSKSSVKVVLKAVIVREGLYGINNWGLINPASVAWELVPFSFVVDWFMPVGNTLEGLTATAGLEFQGGYKNIKKTHTVVAHGTRKGLVNVGREVNQTDIHNPGSCSWTNWEFERWKLEAFPWPEFYANTSPFMNKDGTAKAQRIGNALALLRQ